MGVGGKREGGGVGGKRERGGERVGGKERERVDGREEEEHGGYRGGGGWVYGGGVCCGGGEPQVYLSAHFMGKPKEFNQAAEHIRGTFYSNHSNHNHTSLWRSW